MGSAATMQIAASTRKAERQPTLTISELTMGDRIAPPKPEPESAMEMARPRLARKPVGGHQTNEQAGRGDGKAARDGKEHVDLPQLTDKAHTGKKRQR